MQRSEKKLISIFIQRTNIGICFFDPEKVRLQCSQIRSLCRIAYPMIINKISKCSHLITNCLTHQIFQAMDNQAIQVSVVGDKTFDQQSIQLNLSKISQHLSSITNFKAYFQLYANAKCKFYALGMMLNHVLRQLGSFTLKEKLFIEDIEYFIDTLNELVQIDKNAIEFLQISKQDIHPSLIKGKGASKEGYSLISAYESFLISSGSKKILRYLFMNPTYNSQLLDQRWEIIAWMRENMTEAIRYQKHFKNIHAMESIIKKFGKNHAEEDEEWKKIMKTLQAMLELRRLLALQNMPRLVEDYVNDENWDHIISIYDIFRNAIEFQPLGVRHGIDSTLDKLKKTYDNMPHLLTLIAREQEWDLDFRIVFMTQVGYLIKLSSDVELPQTFDNEDWVLQFSNGSGKYYSNGLTHMLDNQYGDVYGEIQDIEKKIIFDLQTMIVESQSAFLNLYWKISEIQCFWGVSQLSKNMCRPKLSSQALIVSNGWHILLSGDVIHNHSFSFCQSQAPKSYIYNSQQNLANTNYSNRCTLITGPNASGKTIYMKQVAIIVFLTHLGFFVPASFAEVPLYDSIKFIGAIGSIYNDQKCGFSAQLKSLGTILQPNVISNKALILIDQLGAQIDYKNSLKLLYATVDYLTNKEIKFLNNRILSKRNDEFTAPSAIIVTHLSQILRGNILQQNYFIRFLTMSVQQCGLRLFKIKPGLVARGYGIKTAAEILPPSIIAASQKFMKLITKLGLNRLNLKELQFYPECFIILSKYLHALSVEINAQKTYFSDRYNYGQQKQKIQILVAEAEIHRIMINIKRLVLAFKSPSQSSHLSDCYAIIQCGQAHYYCRTVSYTDGKLSWTFDAEIVRLAVYSRKFTIKLAIFDYGTCKIIEDLQLLFQQVDWSSKCRFMTKQFDSGIGAIQLQIQYLCEKMLETKRMSEVKNFDGASKKTCATNYDQSYLRPSELQKVGSSKLLPSRQMDYYNFGPYCSPRHAAEVFVKNYRQSKESYLYQSISMRKIGSYKLLI